MKTQCMLSCCSILAFGMSATAEKSESHTRSVDQHGTEVSQERVYEESRNILGTKKENLELSKVTNPKGVNNEVHENLHVQREIDRDGDSSTSVTGLDAAGTALKEIESKSTGKNWRGEATTTTTRTEERDPRGLGNKTKTDVEEKTIRHSDGTVTRKKTVDGEAVAESRAGR